MGRTNAHHTPYWAVVLYLAVSAAVIVAAGGRDQELVLFYAVSVFMSFLAGLLAMLKFSRHQHKRGAMVLNAAGALLRRVHAVGQPGTRLPDRVACGGAPHSGDLLPTLGEGGAPARHLDGRPRSRSELK